MSEFAGIIVLDEERYEGIVTKEIEGVRYGEVQLDKDEEAAMKLHPKMSLPRRLREGYQLI